MGDGMGPSRSRRTLSGHQFEHDGDETGTGRSAAACGSSAPALGSVHVVVGAPTEGRVRALWLLVRAAAADQPRLQVLEATHRAALQRLDPVTGVLPQPDSQLA